MGDRDSQTKPEEQYPLLKIDGGGDIGIRTQPEQTVVNNNAWGVTCTKKYSRFSRWPEFISACWMTIILCGMSFLIFYTLGMGVYRRHQFIIMKCNNSRPASNVFYHHIVPRGSQISFVLYTEYLSYMAIKYPLLHYHVYFLVDDYSDTLRSMRRNIPYSSRNLFKIDEINKEALAEFQRRYQNVNVTIMPLSKYIAMTSLRYKYRLNLPFYIRVFSVWQNGGIGIDLRKFNDDFHNHRLTDPRIDAILRQHNDGINTDDYTNTLNKIDKEEENELCSMFYGLINHFLNETRSFFNRSIIFPPVSPIPKSPLIRTHRNKREVTNDTADYKVINENVSDSIISSTAFDAVDAENSTLAKAFEFKANTTNQDLVATTDKAMQDPNGKPHSHENGSETHQVILFYDFSIFSDIGPSYLLSKPYPNSKTDGEMPEPTKPVPHLLSMDSEGSFVAASSRLHPFLGHLITNGCQRLPPRFAIQDTLLSQCSGLFREDVYCNNIYVL